MGGGSGAHGCFGYVRRTISRVGYILVAFFASPIIICKSCAFFFFAFYLGGGGGRRGYIYVCVCARASVCTCVRACVRVCMRVSVCFRFTAVGQL